MAASLVDSIRVDDPGPSITAQDLQELEQEIGAGLPSTMTWMLLKYNGGRPTPKTFEVKGHPERLFDIQLFYGVTGDVECETIGWNIREFPELAEKGLVPFARTDTGDQLLLDLHDGSVVFWDAMEEDPDQRCYRIADDHAAFLTDLRTEDYH